MLMHHPVLLGAERHPERTALRWVDRGRSWSYGELARLSARMAGALHHLGVRPGERVGIVAHNGVDYLLAMLGAWRIGAIAALTSVRQAGQLAESLADHTPAVVIYTHELHAEVVAASRACGARAWVCMDGARGDGSLGLDALLAQDWPPTADPGREDAVAHLAYTSGTTGRPKGACLMHEPTVRASRCIAERLRLDAHTVSLGATALSSSYALVANLLPVWAVGGCVQVMSRWDAETGWSALHDSGATYFPANPPLLTDVLVQSRARGAAPAPLRLGLSGGGAVPPSLKRAWRDELGLPLVESFGQSELGGFMALGRPDLEPDDSALLAVGNSLPDKELWISPLAPADAPMAQRRLDDPRARCRPGEVGAIVLRGGCMAGYWNRPEKTAEVLRGDCLVTGDLGFMDADGRLCVRGRASEVLRVDGADWFARDVEDRLAEHPAVAMAALIGLPRADGGHDPVAVVQLRTGATELPAALKAFVAEVHAPSAARLRIEPIAQMPMTPTGKIAKTELVRAFSG